ncbi:MAG TPA: hypothetical protein EYO60_00015 [Candidatus Lambdaproteobacteria bacterium]|jgi:hypothetical protein|nr:hypothetical protein [SAR324 cluster bacterium]HBL54735.1 hypothetical protein [Deltaproteobacteria bacterium]HIB92679.1 hypothetical protein [Candidatus Lambdaproteobacteria bacterium]HIO83194.1 hypothetical protein [Deltaproteobacteria bacterium]
MKPDFSQFGTWIYIDPDEQSIELIEETLDLDMLCELLRCYSTDMEGLGGPFLAYFDGEGASQERQTEWEFNENAFWGPTLIVKIGKEESWLETCNEKDLAVIEPLVKFFD